MLYINHIQAYLLVYLSDKPSKKLVSTPRAFFVHFCRIINTLTIFFQKIIIRNFQVGLENLIFWNI